LWSLLVVGSDKVMRVESRELSRCDPFIIAGREFHSRLLVGTGKYKDLRETYDAIAASGADIVTVAVRRVDLAARDGGSLQEALAPLNMTYLPNTAGCYSAAEAVRTLRLARELGGWNLVKLEVIGDTVTLLPDVIETLEATKQLVADGFDVMVYTNDDPLMARKLEDAGAAAIMPLAAPIGSGLGIQNPLNIRLIIENARVPVLIDAGVGTASDAAVAMELGCAGVLLNTAIAAAQHPVLMAEAMRHAVIAGRKAFLAGRMEKRGDASASSPALGIMSP
jgi:thiazole synthase